MAETKAALLVGMTAELMVELKAVPMADQKVEQMAGYWVASKAVLMECRSVVHLAEHWVAPMADSWVAW